MLRLLLGQHRNPTPILLTIESDASGECQDVETSGSPRLGMLLLHSGKFQLIVVTFQPVWGMPKLPLLIVVRGELKPAWEVQVIGQES